MRILYLALIFMLGCSESKPNPPDYVPAFDGVLILGEIHGTQNAPSFFVETIREIYDRPLAIGFEVPRSMQAKVDAFLVSDGSSSARQALLQDRFWTDGHDGRSSVAFFESLELIRKLKLVEDDVTVFLFDAPPPRREAKMAEAIVSHAQKTKTVVFTGNVHARTTIGVPWDPKFKPMGWYIARSVSVKSYDINGADGHAWNCQKGACKAHPLKGSAPSDRWQFHHFDGVDERGFSGEFWVGKYEPSAPKVP